MILYTSESSNGIPRNPVAARRPAARKFSRRPVSSLFRKSVRTVTKRFVSKRGYQNPARIATFVISASLKG